MMLAPVFLSLLLDDAPLQLIGLAELVLTLSLSSFVFAVAPLRTFV